MKLLLRNRRLQAGAFDPALPEDGALIIAGVLRDQFNGLKALIDAIESVDAAQVDDTVTLPPGSPATATVTVVGDTLHFTFSIPRGNDGQQGPQGPQGPPGEVTTAEMSTAIYNSLQQTSANSNGVNQLSQSADGMYNQNQMQDVMNKLDELIGTLRRWP